MLRKLLIAALPVAPLTFTQTAGAAPPPVGGLTAPSGSAACFTASCGAAGCTPARAIDGAESAAVSPDGKNVYVGSYKSASQESLSVFSRDPATGALTQLPGTGGCLTADGASPAGPGTCTRVREFGIGDGHDLVFSSDGNWAYMVNQRAAPADPGPSILIFKRDVSTGALTQLAGTAGCITNDGASVDGPGTCQSLPTLGQPFGISISPDDRNVYTSEFSPGTRINAFSRDKTTGVLTPVQCLSEAPVQNGCTAGRALGGSQVLAFTPDGFHAYSSDFNARGISIFDRDPATGILTQKPGSAGCISDSGIDGSGGSTCATGRALGGARGLGVSPDGHTLYVSASTDKSVAVFHVGADGAITQLPGAAGCITLSGNDQLGNPTCAVGRGIRGPFASEISPDGRTLYVISDFLKSEDGVAVFSLDPSSGAATQLPGLAGCITADGSSGGVSGLCAAGGAVLAGTYWPAVSPDGTSLYVPGFDGKALSVFRREPGPVCAAISVATGHQAPVRVTLSCRDADGETVTPSIVSPPVHGALSTIDETTGTITYIPDPGYSATDSFTFSASDGTNASTPATATITVGAAMPVAVTPGHSGGSGARTPTPILTHVRQSHRRWREPGFLRRGLPAGTTFTFTLNETARVTLSFTQQLSGRRVNGRCVARAAGNRHRPACARTLFRGSLSVSAHAGQNRLAFGGRLPAAGKLVPGTYILNIVAASGRARSRAQTLTFTIAPDILPRWPRAPGSPARFSSPRTRSRGR